MQDEASEASSRQQISPGLHAELQQQGGLAALLVANLLRAMHLGGHAGKLIHWCLLASTFTGVCHCLPINVLSTHHADVQCTQPTAVRWPVCQRQWAVCTMRSCSATSLSFNSFAPCHAGAEAALLVPRILTVLTGSGPAAESAGDAFAKGWEGVPLRFMLPWAAQMLTLLDADSGEVLLPALMVSFATTVALHVMPALLSPLKISRPENVTFRHILPNTVAVLAAQGRHISVTESSSLLFAALAGWSPLSCLTAPTHPEDMHDQQVPKTYARPVTFLAITKLDSSQYLQQPADSLQVLPRHPAGAGARLPAAALLPLQAEQPALQPAGHAAGCPPGTPAAE